MLNKFAIYERVAPLYDLLDLPSEHFRYRRIRPELFAGLRGRILDAGVGTGRNIPFYPPHAEVVGIDLSTAMLARARRRRERLGANVELRQMDVRRTDFSDGHFDAIVATFLFCVLDDDAQGPALRELRRICRRGGDVRLLDYTLPEDGLQRFMMRRVWGPIVSRLYGAAFDRNTEQYLEAAGLRPVEARFVYRDLIKLIVAKHAA